MMVVLEANIGRVNRIIKKKLHNLTNNIIYLNCLLIKLG